MGDCSINATFSANGRRVAGRAAADDGYVVDGLCFCFGQGKLQSGALTVD